MAIDLSTEFEALTTVTHTRLHEYVAHTKIDPTEVNAEFAQTITDLGRIVVDLTMLHDTVEDIIQDGIGAFSFTESNFVADTNSVNENIDALDRAIKEMVLASGTGDMTRVVYDKDNDGVVDDSKKLGGREASKYAGYLDSVASVTVLTTGWVASGNANWPYKYEIADANITSSDVIAVSYHEDYLQYATGIVCPTPQSYAGGVRLLANSIPSNDIVIGYSKIGEVA